MTGGTAFRPPALLHALRDFDGGGQGGTSIGGVDQQHCLFSIISFAVASQHNSIGNYATLAFYFCADGVRRLATPPRRANSFASFRHGRSPGVCRAGPVLSAPSRPEIHSRSDLTLAARPSTTAITCPAHSANATLVSA